MWTDHNIQFLGFNFLNNLSIFNPKPAFESPERQLLLYDIICDLAIAPGSSIRQITMCKKVAHFILQGSHSHALTKFPDFP